VRLFVENDASEPAQRDMFIDAHTGDVVFEFDSLETAKGGKPSGGGGGGTTVKGVTGSGNTMYSGIVALSLNNPSSGTYTMQDTTRGVGSASSGLGNYTMDMASSTRRGSIVTGSSTSFGDGSLNNTDAATAPADAHYGLEMTWDYYKNVHNRTGIDGNGNQTYSRVHYSRNYENAFWSDSCFCMTYGDGASTFYPLVSIDVAGHEMSHGVTSRSANLTYSGESGGLNEATSDIFGTAVEFYANSSEDQPDWLIGERVWRSNWSNGNFSSNPRALRYMNDPAADGRSPACWSSTLGSLDVHYSSGPANHMFYLLSVGGKSKCNGNTVSGITIQKAEKIWYRALTRYMTSSTNYAGARNAALNAATDLYGANSSEYNAVAAAFSAINVN